MDFSQILLQKKKSLKPVETIVTNVLGQKIIEKRDKYGVLSTTKLFHKCSGFVIDNNPDLQVCQILNYLFLGSQDPLQDSYLLQKFGITHVLTVGVTLSNSLHLPNIVHKKIELLDVPEASLLEALKISLDFIETVHEQNLNNKIFVHCNAGYSRSPAIVIGYLMKKYRYSLEESYKFVNERRKIRPNDGFIKQLKIFEKALK